LTAVCSQAKVEIPSRRVSILTLLGSMMVTSHSPAKNDVILTLFIGVAHFT
jgi:hypothetical protein